MIKKQKQQTGFSILEVVVTLFIIGVTLSIFVASANALNLNRNLKHQEIALRVANKQLQTLRKIPFDDLPADGSFTDSQLDLIPNGEAEMDFVDEAPFLKRVILTVSWNAVTTGQTQSVILETFITKGGLGK